MSYLLKNKSFDGVATGVKSVQGQPMVGFTSMKYAKDYAKQFATVAAAEKFLAKWDGAGVGLDAADWEVVPFAG